MAANRSARGFVNAVDAARVVTVAVGDQDSGDLGTAQPLPGQLAERLEVTLANLSQRK